MSPLSSFPCQNPKKKEFFFSQKMPKGKPWSVGEEKQLREMVEEHKRVNEIAEFFGESPESIKQRISRLRLKVVVC